MFRQEQNIDNEYRVPDGAPKIVGTSFIYQYPISNRNEYIFA